MQVNDFAVDFTAAWIASSVACVEQVQQHWGKISFIRCVKGRPTDLITGSNERCKPAQGYLGHNVVGAFVLRGFYIVSQARRRVVGMTQKHFYERITKERRGGFDINM